MLQQQEFASKRDGHKQYHYDKHDTGRRSVSRGENVDFICWYLFNNPGARYTHVLRALCHRNGIEYKPGQYSHYFNSGYGGGGYVGRLWQRCGEGWILTLEGMSRYGEWCV